MTAESLTSVRCFKPNAQTISSRSRIHLSKKNQERIVVVSKGPVDCRRASPAVIQRHRIEMKIVVENGVPNAGMIAQFQLRC